MSTIDLTPSRAVTRRAGLAGFLGTTVEAYDFFVFTYLVAYIAPAFFPGGDPIVGILNSLAVLGTGFLARPIGGIVFGRLGDKYGRRPILISTILMMGASTVAMGLLPTYESVGILAPILLVVVRLLQGAAAGGEVMGSATFVSEHAGRRNHGILSSMTPMGFALGTAIAPFAVALTAAFSTEEFMVEGGWRIPLLLSLPMTAIVFFLRAGLDDSPEFRRLAAVNEVRKSPIRELLRHHKLSLLKVIGISASVLALGYIVAGFFPLFQQQQLGLPVGTTAGIASFAAFAGMLIGFSAGLATDRIGRRATLILILALSGGLMFPVLFLMLATGGAIIPIALLQMIMGGLGGAAAVPAYATFTTIFPPSVRYTGAAIGFGIGSAIGGGFAPFLSQLFTQLTGNVFAPAGVAIVAALIGITLALRIPNRGAAVDPGVAAATPVVDAAPASAQQKGV